MRIIIYLSIVIFFSSCSYVDSLFIKEIKTDKIYKSPKISQKSQNEILVSKEAKVKTNLVNFQSDKPKEIQVKPKSNLLIPYKKIAFIGDSHLASDYIPEYFRKALNIHSLGFVPAILPKWHNQYLADYNNLGFNVEYLINTKTNLSFGGINANCNTKCEININLKFKANNVEYLEFKSGIWNIKNYQKNTNQINFSTTANKIGGFITNNSSYIDNLGINGASIFNYSRIDYNLAKSVAKKLDYDLIIFSFGTNESVSNKINQENFINNYLNIIELFKTKKSKIILLIPPEPTLFVNKNYVKGENNALVKTLIKQVAKTSGVYIFDIDNLMQKEGGKIAWINDKKSLKNTHLTKSGYEYVAFRLLEFLKITKE
ncbi:GDSL-type esterase/lipase family protein [Campylobacter sp. RM12637]|uniref:GDSL-type esterase/lipase family protein n=1 Tax=Campylobacter sp. RM12637 TaxID=2735734 RepID=UPI0030157E96|nr:hypothetical protein [Campylobacter sp. RM12637]